MPNGRSIGEQTARARWCRKLVEALLRRTQDDLAERTAHLRDLAAELTLVEQRERQRLAEVLHDGLQQLLCGIKLKILGVEKMVPRGSTVVSGELINLINQTISMSRHLTRELDPPDLRGHAS